MRGFKRWVGSVWSVPATIIGKAYVAYVGCEYAGAFGDAFVYYPKDKRLKKKLELEALVIGQVVLMHEHPRQHRYNAVILKHAQKHVEHWMVFGVFTPIIRCVVRSLLKLLNNVDSVYDDPFEISARRHADQTIDIPGIRKRLSDASKRNKL
jgi:hypothetical protein